jgi:AraC-like DNA-binding protein
MTMHEWEEVARQADFKAAKMASICSISERQLQRLFRQHLDCTPSHWLRTLQCRLARDLIARGATNKAVASELKFANESHFCREFKKFFGASPQTFAELDGHSPQARPTHGISKDSWKALSLSLAEPQ